MEKSNIEFREELMKAAAQTAARLNLSVTQHAILYKSTVQRWEKRHRVVTDSTPEETTQARTIACADIRNIVSSLASFSSKKDMQPWQLNSLDATRFVVGNVEGKTHEKMCSSEGRRKASKDPSRTSLVSFFIKTDVLIDAEGSLGPLCHCIASQDTSEDQIVVHPCGGLGTNRRIPVIQYTSFLT